MKQLLKPIIEDENDELKSLISYMRKTDVRTLSKIVRYLSKNIPEDIMYLLLKNKFSKDQEEGIMDAVEMGIPIRILKHYATPDVDANVMEFFNSIFAAENNITDDDLNFAFDGKFDPDQSLAICTAIIDLEDRDMVRKYADSKFSAEQMEVIYEGLACGLTIEQVDEYANTELTPMEMDSMRIYMLDNC